ncbi:uncharacterized protein [Oscarella lobularis]|uniref:uncharacterized protein isoform X2 n=1 Tax=Oscarella lobularis TaxID=121494 RepID=UPI00331408B4
MGLLMCGDSTCRDIRGLYKAQSLRLAVGADISVGSVLLNALDGSFVWCERDRKESGVGRWTVYTRSFDVRGESASIGKATSIMRNCPLLSIHQTTAGICLHSDEENVLLFHHSATGQTKPFIWNYGVPLIKSTPALDFKTLSSRLEYTVQKCTLEKSRLLCLHSHHITNQLIALSSLGEIFVFDFDEETPHSEYLCQLTPFLDEASKTVMENCQLFSFRNFVGVCFSNGLVRMFLLATGLMIWQSSQFLGRSVSMWTANGSNLGVGLWTNETLYHVKSRPIVEQAQLVASGNALMDSRQFPVPVTGEINIVDCHAEASKLCHMWGLRLWADKFALDGFYTLIKTQSSGGEGRVPDKLLNSLSTECLQSPALLVTMLVHFPYHRQWVVEKVKSFLKSYKTEGQKPKSSLLPVSTEPIPLSSKLNAEMVPLLEDYVALSDQFEATLRGSISTESTGALKVRDEVLQILQTNFFDSSVTGPSAQALRLQSLSEDFPNETLDGLFDYMKINNLDEAIDLIKNHTWESDVDWKNFLGASLETADFHYAGIFELTCCLLYRVRPEMLVQFVKLCQQARNYKATSGDSLFARQTREYPFCKRALDCLPPFVSSTVTPTSIAAVKARVQLMLSSGESHVEVGSLRLYLKCGLWQNALDLAKKLAGQHTTHFEIFTEVLAAFLEAGVLKDYQTQVWSLVPENFRLQDLLSLLESSLPRSAGASGSLILSDDSLELTISDVTSVVNRLAEQLQKIDHI